MKEPVGYWLLDTLFPWRGIKPSGGESQTLRKDLVMKDLSDTHASQTWQVLDREGGTDVGISFGPAP